MNNTMFPLPSDDFQITGSVTSSVPSNYYGNNVVNAGNLTGTITTSTGALIRGKMFVAQISSRDNYIQGLSETELKGKMVLQLADELFRSNHIEFTKQIDLTTDSTIIRARIFAVPSEDVQILRKNGY